MSHISQFVTVGSITRIHDIHYRLPICPFQIRVETQVIRTVFSTRVPNSQSPLVTEPRSQVGTHCMPTPYYSNVFATVFLSKNLIS